MVQWRSLKIWRNTRSFGTLVGIVALLAGQMHGKLAWAEDSAKPAEVVFTLQGDQLSGGAQHRYGSKFLGREHVNFVYSQQTGPLASMRHEFVLDKAPVAALALHVTAADDERSQPCRVAIQINGHDLRRGESGFPHGQFETQKLEIPAGLLKQGTNSLTIANLEPTGPAGSQPWFMVASAMLAPPDYREPMAPISLKRDPNATQRSIGIARIDITPAKPVLLSGYANRRHQVSLNVAQKLWARALVIGTDDEGPVVLIAVDNCGVPATVHRAVAAELSKRYRIPRERLTICSTHTHSAPMLTGVLENLLIRDVTPQERKSIDGYTQELTQKLIEVAGEALAAREPSYLHLGNGTVQFAINRRGSHFTDPALPVLVVANKDGKPRAILANYACHCVAAGLGEEINGDWAGYAAEAIEAEVPGATAILVAGCGADQNPNPKGTLELAKQHGRTLADEVRRVLATGLPSVDGKLTTDFAEISVPFSEPPNRAEWEALAKEKGINGYHARKNLARLDRGESLQKELTYPVQTWKFGRDLAMVFLGGEVVVDYSLALKKTIDPDRLWISSYANDVPCYIPSERVLKEGRYEGGGAMVWYDKPGPLATGVEKLILDEVVRQMGDLSEWKHLSSRTGGTLPLSPSESMARMKVRDGFRVELVAAEPLVIDPVAIDFSPDGKLWVAEMRDYPEGIPGASTAGGIIKFLTDSDGDGRYDKATVFLEDVPFPTGVTAWRDGLLVCAAPDVLYAEDTDGDGRADVRRTLLSGFATHNYQARVNSLSLGLDNWMHGAAGIFGGNISAPGKNAVDSQNRDFRFLPDDGRVEPVSGRTQQGRARDDWGNWFGCTNSVLLLHYPTTDHYHARNRHVALPSSVVGVAAARELFPSGDIVRFKLSGAVGTPTSVCGLSIYRDNLLGDDFANNAFVCEPVNQLVHRMVLEPQGATFTGKRAAGEEKQEFLSSSDNWFRPVQTRTGPDGALWVVDMYRYVIEHPKFISDDVKTNLDTRAGDTRGRIYRVVPVDQQPRKVPTVRNLDAEQLAMLLESPNGTVRDRAHLELLWRNERRASNALKELAANSKHAPGRLHALCVLDGLGLLTAELVADALRDEHPGVRRHGARLAEKFIDESPEVARLIVRATDDADAQVRLQAAYSLGASSNPAMGRTLAKLVAAADKDSYLKTAVLSSLNAINVREVLSGLEPPNLNSDATIAVLKFAAEAADQETLEQALQALLQPAAGGYGIRQLSALPQVMRALGRRKIELSKEHAAAWDRALEQARTIVADTEAPAALRVAAIGLLPFVDDAGVVQSLADCLTPQNPAALQQAALKALADRNDPAAVEALFGSFRQLVPSLQAIVLDEALAQERLTRALIDQLEAESLPLAQIDLSRRQVLINHPNAEIQKRAKALFAAPSNSEVVAQIAALRTADLSQGSAAKGREVFAKHCAACHRLDGLGHVVGPDLKSLTDKSKQYMLVSILDPNAAVDRRYATYTAITVEGRIHTGVLTAEAENSITLKEKEGVERVLLRSDLEELQSTGKSMMPDGLGRELPVDQLRDLLAFVGATGLEAVAQDAAQGQKSDDSAKRIASLVAEVEIGTPDEYRKIPDIWRVAIDAGKRNDADEILALLKLSLPSADEPLRDWQAVVIGGGVINGITMAGEWPADRIDELLKADQQLAARWKRAIELSIVMADDPNVKSGTRYDALRMVAMQPFDKCQEQLQRYLAKGVPAELQQGAVSGFADVPHPGAAVALVGSLEYLNENLRKFAVDGLIRPHGKVNFLVEAVEGGKISRSSIPQPIQRQLLEHPMDEIRQKAKALFAASAGP